jgi:hypothetical protein
LTIDEVEGGAKAEAKAEVKLVLKLKLKLELRLGLKLRWLGKKIISTLRNLCKYVLRILK